MKSPILQIILSEVESEKTETLDDIEMKNIIRVK